MLCKFSSARPRRRDLRQGLSLVELLVVITILTIVTVASIPIMAPATGPRRQREAARMVSSFFASAQSQAIATGRPTGVWIERDQPQAGRLSYAASTLYICEVPPPYAGDTANTVASCVKVDSPQTTPDNPADPLNRYLFFEFSIVSGNISPGMIRIGDRVQFNNQGYLYEVHNGDTDSDGFVDVTTFLLRRLKRFQDPVVGNPNYESNFTSSSGYRANTYLPWPVAPAPTPPIMSFKIFRQPQRSTASAMRLPEGAVIDMRWSGPGNDFGGRFAAVDSGLQVWSARGPLIVMFSPQGNLSEAYTLGAQSLETAPASLHFLIGKNERVTTEDLSTIPTLPTSDNDGEFYNFQDTDNFWVTVQRGNGLAATSQLPVVNLTVPPIPSPAPAGFTAPNWQYYHWVNSTRRFAQQTRTVGGL